ncbi:MAG: hypothetical protein NT062_35790 [Proteobacteria bacterium]|nr:hypothetical protein [Pseudomonadota bacterium]
MIRWLIILGVCCVLAFLGSTVPIGKKTFFGHIRAIWTSSEMTDMKDGIEEKAGPAAEKIKRGVKKGLDEATKDVVDEQVRDAMPAL